MADYPFIDGQGVAASRWFNERAEREVLGFVDGQPVATSQWWIQRAERESLRFKNWMVVAGDTTIPPKPVIENFVPMPGVAIARLQYIGFDVTSASSILAAVFVTAMFSDGNCECVFDNRAFSPRYAAGSSVAPIQQGFHFVVRRAGGWYATPLRIDVFAIDVDGSVTTTQVGF